MCGAAMLVKRHGAVHRVGKTTCLISLALADFLLAENAKSSDYLLNPVRAPCKNEAER